MPEEQQADALDELRRLGSAVGAERVEWVSPPPDLWTRIAAEAFPSDDVSTGGVSTGDVSTGDASTGDGAVSSAQPVVSLEEHRRSRGWWLVGAAAAVVVAMVAVTTWVRQAEVWMINPDVTQLISLGPIRSDGIYDLPAGLDPAAFPIVDVSFESFDGNPQHSGNSVLRGELAF